MSKNNLTYKEQFHDPPHDVGFNPDEYMEDLKDCDLSDEQKHEMLQALWHIMSSMVDLGWGVDTVHIVLPELFSKAADENNALPVNPQNAKRESSPANNNDKAKGMRDER